MGDWRSYDDVADTYERVHASRFADVARDLVGLLQVGSGQRVLDVGTGTGTGVEEARRAGARAVGVDRSGAMLATGRRVRPALPLVAGEAIDLPFRNGTFDVVMGNFVLAHFTKVETALFDLVRVLVRGGRIGFTAWSNGRDAYQEAWGELLDTVVPRDMLAPAYAAAAPGHDRFQRPEEIDEVLRRAGFRNIRIEKERYRWVYPRDDFVDGLGTWAVGRFVRNMLGEDAWASLMERARASFADRFPDPLNEHRGVILAVGSLP